MNYLNAENKNPDQGYDNLYLQSQEHTPNNDGYQNYLCNNLNYVTNPVITNHDNPNMNYLNADNMNPDQGYDNLYLQSQQHTPNNDGYQNYLCNNLNYVTNPVITNHDNPNMKYLNADNMNSDQGYDNLYLQSQEHTPNNDGYQKETLPSPDDNQSSYVTSPPLMVEDNVYFAVQSNNNADQLSNLPPVVTN